VTFTEFREDKEAMIRFALNAQLLHGQSAHTVAEWHERTLVTVKLECPSGRNECGGHALLLQKAFLSL
jgi:hypothetical protein